MATSRPMDVKRIHRHMQGDASVPGDPEPSGAFPCQVAADVFPRRVTHPEPRTEHAIALAEDHHRSGVPGR